MKDPDGDDRDESKAIGGYARAQALDPKERQAIARKAALARWGGAKPLRATHTGTLSVKDALQLPCAVLEGEKRVLSQRGFYQGLGASTPSRNRGDGNTPAFLAAKNLKAFIPEELATTLSQPILYQTPGPGRARGGGNIAYGIPAELIPDICDVWLKARDAGELHHRQVHIADRAELLMRGLAKVGIIALIDEATGFQDERTHNALAKILEEFIAKELRPYVKTFPHDFYKEIYRLRGWEYPPKNNRHNSFLGKLTNDLVYDRLAPGVRDELHRLTPRRPSGRLKNKLFQRLSEDVGHPKLREHLGATVMAMKLSKEWDPFYETMNRLLPPYPPIEERNGQRTIQFPDSRGKDERS